MARYSFSLWGVDDLDKRNPSDKVLNRILRLKLLFVCRFRSSVRSTGRPWTGRQKSSTSSSSSSAQRTTIRITPSATSASPTWVLKTGLRAGGHSCDFNASVESQELHFPPDHDVVRQTVLKENWSILKAQAYFISCLKNYRLDVCLSVSPEEGEELWEGGDPHSVHELAGPRRSRGGAAPPQAEAPRQRLQEFLQRPHRRPLQVRLVTDSFAVRFVYTVRIQ